MIDPQKHIQLKNFKGFMAPVRKGVSSENPEEPSGTAEFENPNMEAWRSTVRSLHTLARLAPFSFNPRTILPLPAPSNRSSLPFSSPELIQSRQRRPLEWCRGSPCTVATGLATLVPAPHPLSPLPSSSFLTFCESPI